MGKIILKDIKVYGYHGCLIEEGQIGSDYHVNLTVEANLTPSAISDKLSDTVDYVHLNKIVEDEMAIRADLLETVAKRILNRIISEHAMVNKATVTVSKINPPIEGDVKMVSIEMSMEK